jgi:hypothetical protein
VHDRLAAVLVRLPRTKRERIDPPFAIDKVYAFAVSQRHGATFMVEISLQ